ncbi:ribonuclease R [Rhodobacteraceae bacterium MBR-64]
MTDIPSKPEILAWIAENPTLTAKRDIARAFGIKGAARIDLKRVLREMEDAGDLEKRRKTYRDPERLPPVSVLEVLAPDAAGDLFARPLEWRGEGREPRVLFVARKSDPALGEGDRILARLHDVEGATPGGPDYEARLIRKIGVTPRRILGIFRAEAEGGRILPIDKGADKEWRVAAGATQNARDGELVEVEQAGSRNRLGLPQARVIARLGDPSGPRAVSLIAIHQHGIPDQFPPEVLREAEAELPADLGSREDLRHLPIITIDPADARDRDDAVHAHADDDPKNPGGHVVWVLIADVAHHVRPGTALDREAWNRGNSTYFPDRVVPMLPDRLSGDLCSLHEGVPRACIAVRLRQDAHGKVISHRFTRGLMQSQAALNYEQVQAAADGRPDAQTAPLVETVIAPLYAAYKVAAAAREHRQPLDLDLPERRVELDADGNVTGVAFKDRLEAHRLIEEFMILANVAAAEELRRLRHPLLYRVHEEPSPEKLDALREVAQASGFTLAKGQVLQTRHLNNLLSQAEGTAFDELMNMTTLRSMTQAYYAPENLGHFGLALQNYAHFTSPIRRYADLVVHRALITAHGWGKDGLSPQEVERLEETAKHISETERRSMAAERDTNDRYLAAYLSERVGSEFDGRISGVTRFGLFVRLADTGADGLIPIRTLGREYFHFDANAQTLMGDTTGLVLGIGQRVTVRLAEAVPVTGGLMLELLAVEGKDLPQGPKAARGRFNPRMPARGKAKADKTRRKAERKRRG